MASELTLVPRGELKFKNAELNKITDRIYTTAAKAKNAAEIAGRELAEELAEIESKTLYKEDGFKSLAEYGAKIGLAKSTVHQYSNAGKIYRDAEAPKQLKSITPSNLFEVVPMYNNEADRKTLFADAESGKLDGMTQAKLREYKSNAQSKQSKATVVKTYQASFSRDFIPLIDYVYQDGETVVNTDNATLEQWETFSRVTEAEVIKIKPLEVTVAKKDKTITRKYPRLLIIDAEGKPAIVYFREKVTEPATKSPDYGTATTAKTIADIAKKVLTGVELSEVERKTAIKYGLIEENGMDTGD